MGSACSSEQTTRRSRYEVSNKKTASIIEENSICSGSLTALSFKHEGSVNDIAAASTTSDYLITGGDDGCLALHDTASGGLLKLWKGSDCRPITRVSAGKDLFASASRDLSINLWGVSSSTAETVLRGHTMSVSGLSLSRGSERLVCSGSRDTTVRVWDCAVGGVELFKATRALNIVTCMRWHPGFGIIGGDGEGEKSSVFLQASEDLRVLIWDTRCGTSAVSSLTGFTYFPLCLDISTDGLHVLTSSKGFNSVGCELRTWDLRGGGGGGGGGRSETIFSNGGTCTAQFKGHAQDTTACAFLGDSRIISASKDGTIRVWDRLSTVCLRTHQEPNCSSFTSITILPSGMIAASSSEGSLYVYRFHEEDDTLKLVTRT